LLVIGTSSDGGVMKDLGVADAFNMVFNIPLLKEDEIRQVFVELGVFQPQEVGSSLVERSHSYIVRESPTFWVQSEFQKCSREI
jgi:hypothetical protein